MAAAPALHLQMAEAAQQLLGSLQAGDFAGAGPDAQEGLQGLARAMSGWADRLETAEADRLGTAEIEHLEHLLACWRQDRAAASGPAPRTLAGE